MNSDKNPNATKKIKKCCSGMCIDILSMLMRDLEWEVNISEVDDRNWGILKVLANFNFILIEIS